MTIALTQNQVAEVDLSTAMSREIASIEPIGVDDDRLALPMACCWLCRSELDFGLWWRLRH